MKKFIFISVLVVSFSIHAQTWFQGGAGSGFDFSQLSYCDSNSLDAPYQASSAASSGDSFISASCLFVLPIELVNFNIQSQERTVQIKWETITELNNDFFTVQRSSNNFDWEDIEIVDGAGNSADKTLYRTSDLSPLPNVSYYRLKQTDFDGASVYSEIRSVYFNRSMNELIAFPNPTKKSITLIGRDIETLQIYNSLGQDVSFKVLFNKIDSNETQVDLEKLKEGVYIFSLANQKLKVIKL